MSRSALQNGVKEYKSPEKAWKSFKLSVPRKPPVKALSTTFLLPKVYCFN